jgi:hypothetical protein
MLAILIIEIMVFGFLCFYAKDKYEDFTRAQRKKACISITIMPAALLIADKLIIGRFIAYERKISIKLAELYGGRDVKHMLKLHITHKVIHLTAALLSVTLLGVLMDKPGIGYAVFALLILVIVFYASDRRLDERIKNQTTTGCIIIITVFKI